MINSNPLMLLPWQPKLRMINPAKGRSDRTIRRRTIHHGLGLLSQIHIRFHLQLRGVQLKLRYFGMRPSSSQLKLIECCGIDDFFPLEFKCSVFKIMKQYDM
mmetsp:Transcript_15799/g.31883  ORF Transcript_15799/g.31883 Transcript_15799/m.31883 type:complete len:102 (+) Transcript_15799:719-1024(+)